MGLRLMDQLNERFTSIYEWKGLSVRRPAKLVIQAGEVRLNGVVKPAQEKTQAGAISYGGRTFVDLIRKIHKRLPSSMECPGMRAIHKRAFTLAGPGNPYFVLQATNAMRASCHRSTHPAGYQPLAFCTKKV